MQLEEERVYSPYTSIALFIIEESRDRNSNKAGTWRQELIQKPWRSATYWLASPWLAQPAFLQNLDHQPRDGTIHNSLAFALSIINLRNAPQPDFMQQSLN